MNKNGFSSVGLILFVFSLIVFFIFPLSSFIVEKSVIYFVVENMCDSMDSSVYSVISDIDIGNLSEEEIKFVEGKIQESFSYMIEKNLLKSTGFKKGKDGIIKEISITKMDFVNDINLNRRYIDCYLVFSYRPALYRSFFESGDYRKLSFNRIIEIPDNN